MYYIAKKTTRMRYKIVGVILKVLTPNLFNRLIYNRLLNKEKSISKTDTVLSFVRPSIEFIKERFNDKLIVGVEIGVQRGQNSEYILKRLNIKKLFLVDIWGDYEGCDRYYADKNFNCVKNKFKNNKKVEIIKAFSVNAVNLIDDNSLDFVYVDGNHKYEYAYQDISLWYPKIKKGGVLGGHDVCHLDVLKAVKDFCFEKNIKFQTEIPDFYFVKESEGFE